MRHIIVLRSYIIIAHHTVALGSSMLWGLDVFPMGQKNDSPSLLLACNNEACITIRIQHNPLAGKYFDLGSITFPVVFSLQCGQEVT